MTLKIFLSIRHLLLSDIGQIDTPVFTISNQGSVKEQLLDSEFKKQAGIKALYSYRNNILGYRTSAIEDGSKDKTEIINDFSKETYSTAKIMESFLLFLWFVKDNSISLDETYGQIVEEKQLFWYTSHSINSNCVGRFEDIYFSKEEVDVAVDLLFKYMEICPDNTNETDSAEFFKDNNITPGKSILKGSKNENDGNNLERAMTYLNTARCTPYVPQRLSLYMSVLESLFSTDPSEVLQKVSERTSYFVGENRDDRIYVFDTIRNAYGIRSKFVHGQQHYKNPENVHDLSTKVDAIIRRVLTKIILKEHQYFISDRKQLEDYLKHLIFQ